MSCEITPWPDHNLAEEQVLTDWAAQVERSEILILFPDPDREGGEKPESEKNSAPSRTILTTQRRGIADSPMKAPPLRRHIWSRRGGKKKRNTKHNAIRTETTIDT